MTNQVQNNPNIPAESYLYEEAFEMMRKEVDRVLSASPLIIREYTRHLAKTEGKYVRAGALLVCAMGEDNRIPKDAIRLGASVEMLHLATLVHDDVIDNADLRRGESTLQKKYGKRTAVICGDYLLAVAMNLAGTISERDRYRELKMPDYMSRICLGELSQHVNNGNFDLSVYRYLKIIAGKTAALFEASFYGGAALIEKEQTVLNLYRKLGRYVGMIFQLIDDCMDFEATESAAKKPVQSDYEQNVITLPLIHSLRFQEGFRDKAASGNLTREEINATVQKTGGLIYTRTLAKKYSNKALAILEELKLTENKKEKLEAVLNKAYRIF